MSFVEHSESSSDARRLSSLTDSKELITSRSSCAFFASTCSAERPEGPELEDGTGVGIEAARIASVKPRCFGVAHISSGSSCERKPGWPYIFKVL